MGFARVLRPSPQMLSLYVMAAVTACGCAIAASPVSRPPVKDVAVAPQYDSTHVYVAPSDLEAFVTSFVATFGGRASKPIVSTVTPTPSSTQFQYVMSPVGTLSTFAYSTPIPFPFGLERTGYLVSDMDQALTSARSAGASIIVAPFKDPIGMDALIEWPGGVKMQLYWHFTAPLYDPLVSVPENRIYISPDRIDNFTHAFIHFSRGQVTSDDWHADGAQLGRPGETFRCITIESKFGKMRVMATDGQLPYPFGYEISGYGVENLQKTLDAAVTHGVTVEFAPVQLKDRRTAIVKFPGGFVAEIHSETKSR
jgi:hypothetical protein